ncbi:unnamed protein product [Bursaphelenchus okinawaensis]|uniref:G-protein coupled receptors family 1 profile domain-containing protein n=1 Tax=Bursaphelenchus okinawaensis TaxID=465554 RepID=A0A811L0L7_9BILA|nr:unnamed protein product [Bursaphelenchus okinawaensis]CAG9114592.1 unnamed protein product [Bursaphelenchus okinawaensis]
MAPFYEPSNGNYAPTGHELEQPAQYDDTSQSEMNVQDNYYIAAESYPTPMDEANDMTEFEEMLIKASFLAGYVYMLLAVTGIILNAYVICRLIQLAINDYERFKHGCGLPLAAMSMSDLWSLVSIIGAVVLSGFLPPSALSPAAHSAHCKITIYLIHTLTGFSTWCWLFISALRYIAVYHPLWHIKGSTLGVRTVLIMLLFALLINAWLPIVVVSSEESRTCEEQPLGLGADWNRFLHGIELCWSYILPAVLTLALDVRVIFVRPPSFTKMAQKKRKQFASRKTPLSLRQTLSDGWSQAEEKFRGFLCTQWLRHKLTKTPRISIVNEDEERKEIDNPEFQNKLNNLLGNVGRARTLTNSTWSAQSNATAASSVSVSPSGLPRIVAYAQNSWQSTCSHSAGSTKRGRKTVRRWLAITTVHLLLNAPDSMYRLASVIESSPSSPNSPSSHLIALVVRLLYFAQFCFNAAYLTAIVYKRNVRPKPRQTTPKHSTTYLRVHPEFSRPQTRTGIPESSARDKQKHADLKRRYSHDPRGLKKLNHLNVNQPLLNAPIMPASYSTETFRSEELELNTSMYSTNTSPRSPSTEPHNEYMGRVSASTSGRTSAGLLTIVSSTPPTPNFDKRPSISKRCHIAATRANSWQV